jgi:uncharacterized membrane protein (DUF485 family)
MFQQFIDNFKKKSLKERFLLVIGILFFLIYLTFGLMVIFWKKLPLNMSDNYRTILGVVIIGYSFLRFIRFFNK